MTVLADLAVIGGSGLYALLSDAEEHQLDTPYGNPAVRPAFDAVVPDIVPTGLLSEANSLDQFVRPAALRLIGPAAGGALIAALGTGGAFLLDAGTFVVPDQLIDRTSGRAQTFYDDRAVHVNFADPYCPRGREVTKKAAAGRNIETHDGTMVVVEGPRFSTRAESRWYTAIGGSVVNMTGHPEAVLARELAICYTAIALVTDLDAGVEGDHGVTQEEVFRVFGENTERLRGLLFDVLAALPEDRDCACARALDDI